MLPSGRANPAQLRAAEARSWPRERCALGGGRRAGPGWGARGARAAGVERTRRLSPTAGRPDGGRRARPASSPRGRGDNACPAGQSRPHAPARGHGPLLPGREAAAGRRWERWPPRPGAGRQAPLALSSARLACASPGKSRGHRPTSSSTAPPEPALEPVPVLPPCSPSGFRLLMVRGRGRREGTRGRALRRPRGEWEGARGAVRSRVRSGWRGTRGAVRGAAAASGQGHIKFGGCGR